MPTGVLLAIATAFFWAIGPLCFASVARRIGSFDTLVLARMIATPVLLAILAVYMLFEPAARQMPDSGQMIWIVVSSALGMVIGDALLYEAFVLVGPRRSTQLLMLTPVFATAMAWSMGQGMGMREVVGSAIVMSAIAVAVTASPRAGEEDREPGKVSAKGVICGVGAAAMIGLSATAGRQSFLLGPLDPVLAATLRVGVSVVMLGFLPMVRGHLPRLIGLLGDPHILRRMIPGVAAGPVLGILCYVGAMKLINPGLLSTLSQTSPLFMIPMIWYRYKAGIGVRAAVATAVAVFGVAVICWT